MYNHTLALNVTSSASSNDQCTGGLYLKCLFEGGAGVKSSPIMFLAPGPPIKVINAMPELPRHRSLRLFCRHSFTSACGS